MVTSASASAPAASWPSSLVRDGLDEYEAQPFKQFHSQVLKTGEETFKIPGMLIIPLGLGPFAVPLLTWLWEWWVVF